MLNLNLLNREIKMATSPEQLTEEEFMRRMRAFVARVTSVTEKETDAV